MLHTGEINILYFLGYVLASIKVRESVEAVSMNVAELYYLDSMCKRIREIRETKIQQGKDQTISSYDIEFDQVSFLTIRIQKCSRISVSPRSKTK